MIIKITYARIARDKSDKTKGEEYSRSFGVD